MAVEIVAAAIQAAPAISQAIVQLAQLLNQSRSVIIEIDNHTPFPWRLDGQDHSHGGFNELPSQILPVPINGAILGASLFSSQSKGGSVWTGTEGWCKFTFGDASFTLRWDVPYFGDNSSSISVEGSARLVPRVTNMIGAGNQNAHARFEIFADVLMPSPAPAPMPGR